MPVRDPWSARLVVAAVLTCAAVDPVAAQSPGRTEPLAELDTSAVPARDPGSRLPDGWQRGVFMEVFVRAYQDSDGDGIGDLRGLTERLEYLHDLGIRGLWLMPVTASADHDHGYAVRDFRAIEPDYGTLTDFDRLLRKAHALGMGVIVDYVLNHNAAANPLFQSAVRDRQSPYRDWFLWAETPPTGWDILGKNPWYPAATGTYFAQFGANMPDFNFRNPAVVAFHHDSLRWWLNRGVDGFRFDAVPHLVENGKDAWYGQPESFAAMAAVRELVHGYAHRYLVCEATGEMQRWAAPEACGSAFAFGHQYEIVKAAKGDVAAVGRVATFFRDSPTTMATFLTNHDGFAGRRLWDQFGGDGAPYRLAAATYLLEPGTPFLFYGEEIGMGGAAGLTDDPQLRIPMSWTSDTATAGFTSGQPFRPTAANVVTHNVAAEQGDPESLLNYYRAIIGLRNAHPALTRGDFSHAQANGEVYAFRRHTDAETLEVLINYGGTMGTATLEGLAPGVRLRSVRPDDGATWHANAAGQVTLGMAPQSLRVLAIDAN